jgi:MFS family permease
LTAARPSDQTGGRGHARAAEGASAAKALVPPLVLAQFIASYAATNMNVAISTIAAEIGTTVTGMQTTITLFTLTMASLMIPGSKLTDIWGRKACFMIGLIVYGVGAALAAVAQGLGLMIVGYSLLEGVGSALMIPPIYILITVAFADTRTRAKYFGAVSGAAGLGAAAGPLIGGVITSGISWRASFALQVLVVLCIIVLGRRITEPPRPDERPAFDLLGAVLSAVALFFIVLGVLQSSQYGWLTSRKDYDIGGTVVIPEGSISPVWIFVAIGALILVWFFRHVRSRERRGAEPLIPLRLFRNRMANLGLSTQLIQWLTLQGSFFVISVFLQQVRHYNAVQTGLALTPATVGILLSAALAERLAKRRAQRSLVRNGFILTVVGMVLLLALARSDSSIVNIVPGLLFIGFGVGVMLTASVNVVQSSFPESDQGEISGLSRSVSNLGSSLGTALAGSVLVAAGIFGGRPYALALSAMLVIAVIGLVLAILLPKQPTPSAQAGSVHP